MRKYLILLGVLLCGIPAQAQQVINGNRVFVAGTGNQVQCTNDGTTGTTINLLAKAVTTGCIKAAITDTNIPLWIVTSATATTGSASLAMAGDALCVMDTTTASGALGDYVIASVTTAGQCHHQAAQPTGVFIVGTLMSDATTSGSTATILVVSSFNSASSGKGTLYTLQTGGLTLTSSQTTYHGFGSTTTSFSTASAKSFSVAAACTASNLRLRTSTTQNAGGSLVVSLYDTTGAAATALVATVTAGGTAAWYHDTTHTVALVPENEYAVQFVNNFAGTSATVNEFAFQCN